MGYFDADEREMLEVYMLETQQLLEQLDGHLLKAEQNRSFSADEIHAVFRIMHTIKGSSAMMRLGDLSRITHKLEDLFAYYREEYGMIKEPEPELFDLLFMASDYISNELEEMGKESYQPRTAADIEKQAEAYLLKARQAKEKEELEKEEEETVPDLPKEEPQEEKRQEESEEIPRKFIGKGGTAVRVRLEEGCRLEHIRAFMLLRQIEGKCTSVDTYPENLDKSPGEADYISRHGVVIWFESEEKDQVLELLKKGLFVASCEILDNLAAKEEEEKPAKESSEDRREGEFLSVRMDRLDSLQNLAGELMIQMLTLDDALAQTGQEDIREGIAYQISRLISDVERNVMEMRLVPVASLVPKLRRIFRDICRTQKKDIEFIANCQDIEADKSVIEYVFEALMHIIRNAVDHGIETPEERSTSGKNKTGKIIFTAENTVGELILSIQDDGRGLDAAKILASARKKGLLEKREEEYEIHEIWNLVLHPGFSTKDQVTEFSGRGVGLDVVKNIMEEAGGHLYIDSEKGKGSKFTVMLPLTLSTTECVRFHVQGYRFSIPARYVFGFFEYQEMKERIQILNEKMYIVVHDKMLPLIDLRHFYHMEGENVSSAIIIHVKNNEREGCIIADYMYEQKRIVVKQLPALFGPGFRGYTGICGLSMMGNGCICSALDIEILVSLYEGEGGVRSGY